MKGVDGIGTVDMQCQAWVQVCACAIQLSLQLPEKITGGAL